MTLIRTGIPRIYALTDPAAGPDRMETVSRLVAAGIQWIQVREKSVSDFEWLRILEAICSSLPAKVRLFVNDRPDLAIACGADGVHLGDLDLPPWAARAVAGDRPLVIGRSSHSLEEALSAAADPAVDYLAIGPIYRSGTKLVREPHGTGIIREVRARTEKPIVAIGGIDADNVAEVIAAGADSAAVIGALYSGGDIVSNGRKLLEAAERAG